VPVYHFPKVKRLPVSQTFVPILQNGKEYVQGSSEIVQWLEDKHPAKPLLPEGEEARERARGIDAQLGKLGVHVRRYVYWILLPEATAGKQALGLYLRGFKKKWLEFTFPILRTAIFKGLNVNASSAEHSLQRVREGLDWLEATRQGRSYLAGERFSYLDLSAASLLSPLSLPPEHPVYSQLEIPEKLNAKLEEFRRHPALKWVDGIYRQYRRV